MTLAHTLALAHTLLWAALPATGMATTYTGYAGAPLYCDGRISQPGSLLFDTVAEPWVALDVSEYTSGRARCGDEILVRFPPTQTSGLPGKAEIHTLRARALDAGPLYPFVIADTGLPIVVDIPAHHAPFPGLSAPATIVNVSAIRRHWIRSRIPQ
ncbi:MAG: hypothetical protein ACK2VA_11895 [Anaerolineae bacterium]